MDFCEGAELSLGAGSIVIAAWRQAQDGFATAATTWYAETVVNLVCSWWVDEPRRAAVAAVLNPATGYTRAGRALRLLASPSEGRKVCMIPLVGDKAQGWGREKRDDR